jgi:hypothetical protein
MKRCTSRKKVSLPTWAMTSAVAVNFSSYMRSKNSTSKALHRSDLKSITWGGDVDCCCCCQNFCIGVIMSCFCALIKPWLFEKEVISGERGWFNEKEGLVSTNEIIREISIVSVARLDWDRFESSDVESRNSEFDSKTRVFDTRDLDRAIFKDRLEFKSIFVANALIAEVIEKESSLVKFSSAEVIEEESDLDVIVIERARDLEI